VIDVWNDGDVDDDKVDDAGLLRTNPYLDVCYCPLTTFRHWGVKRRQVDETWICGMVRLRRIVVDRCRRPRLTGWWWWRRWLLEEPTLSRCSCSLLSSWNRRLWWSDWIWTASWWRNACRNTLPCINTQVFCFDVNRLLTDLSQIYAVSNWRFFQDCSYKYAISTKTIG